MTVGLGTLFRFWVYRTWVFPEETPVVAVTGTEPALSSPDDLDSDDLAAVHQPAVLRPHSTSIRMPGAPLAEPAGARELA